MRMPILWFPLAVVIILASCQAGLAAKSTPIATIGLTRVAPPTEFGDSSIGPTSVTPVPPDNQRWRRIQAEWFSPSKCKLPCWEGIVPGRTPEDEALAVISQLAYVKATTITSEVSRDGDSATTSWEWQDNSGGGGVILEKISDQFVVEEIQLSLLPAEQLGKLIGQLGEPEYVLARISVGFEAVSTPVAQQLYTEIHYLRVGLTLQLIGGDVQQTSEVESIRLHESATISDSPRWILPSVDYLVPWKGYQPFLFYCHDERNGQDCGMAK